MQRFVVLRHEPGAASEHELHWDLMLEQDSSLRTWALDSEPEMGLSIEGRELPDHRQDYLDYEGPVSGQRGSVTQFDRGTFRVLRQSSDELVIELDGEHLRGEVTLQRRGEDQRWLVVFAGA